MSDRVTLRKGKDAEFTIDIVDEDGRSVSIVGQTFIKLQFPSSTTGEVVELFAPVDSGQDEIQKLTYSSVPDSGDFKLKFGTETTVAIAFGAANSAIEAAIEGLKQLSDVTVSGSFAAGHTLTFAGNDGLRDQPLPTVVDNTLKTGAADVTITPSATQEGRGLSGIEVTDDKCTQLTVKVSEGDVELMNVGIDQDMELFVRVGAKDLNIPTLERRLTVEKRAFS